MNLKELQNLGKQFQVFNKQIKAVGGFQKIIEQQKAFTNLIEPISTFHKIAKQDLAFRKSIESFGGFHKFIEQQKALINPIEPINTFHKIAKQDLAFRKSIESFGGFHKFIEQQKAFINPIEPISTFHKIAEQDLAFRKSIESFGGFHKFIEQQKAFISPIESLSIFQTIMNHKSIDTPWFLKIQEVIHDLNSSSPCNSSNQNEKFKTFDPEKEALEEVVDILSDPLESNFEARVDKFILRNKYKIQILVTVLTFLCWYFQEEVESLRVNSKKELIPYVISKIQESNPELLTKTNSQTSETTSDQIDSSLEPQLKLNIFSEDQD